MKLITLLFCLLMLAALIVGVLFVMQPICRDVGRGTCVYWTSTSALWAR
ncbi:MAG TPA: hypothetical protein VGA88_14490 [Burkholderiales bacterium]